MSSFRKLTFVAPATGLMAAVLLTFMSDPTHAAGRGKEARMTEGRSGEASKDEKKPASVLDFTVKDIDGKPVKLSKFKGKTLLIVNVASFCGNTPQYKSMEELYEKYKAKGFVVLGFPANEFGKQEPGSDKEIKEFCTTKYKVTFPMFSKIVVKGDEQAPLYRYLTSKETDPKFAGDIEWNFAKFLVNRKGEVVGRFKAFTDPNKPEVVEAIEKELETK